jgi:hypothetical protein
MKPSFDIMSTAELRAYVLAHRDDNEAFHTLVDRLEESEQTQLYPYPDTPENVIIMDQAIQNYVRELEEKRQG